MNCRLVKAEQSVVFPPSGDNAEIVAQRFSSAAWPRGRLWYAPIASASPPSGENAWATACVKRVYRRMAAIEGLLCRIDDQLQSSPKKDACRLRWVIVDF